MDRFSAIDQILDFAIARETEANKFYTELAKRMKKPEMRQVFEEFAIEEMGHRMKLEAVKAGEIEMQEEQISTINVADYMVDVEVQSDMNYADALVVGMKKEKAAYRLYMDLAAIAEAEELTNVFLLLAQEEAKHKLRFEIEYDDQILKED